MMGLMAASPASMSGSSGARDQSNHRGSLVAMSRMTLASTSTMRSVLAASHGHDLVGGEARGGSAPSLCHPTLEAGWFAGSRRRLVREDGEQTATDFGERRGFDGRDATVVDGDFDGEKAHRVFIAVAECLCEGQK